MATEWRKKRSLYANSKEKEQSTSTILIVFSLYGAARDAIVRAVRKKRKAILDSGKSDYLTSGESYLRAQCLAVIESENHFLKLVLQFYRFTDVGRPFKPNF